MAVSQGGLTEMAIFELGLDGGTWQGRTFRQKEWGLHTAHYVQGTVSSMWLEQLEHQVRGQDGVGQRPHCWGLERKGLVVQEKGRFQAKMNLKLKIKTSLRTWVAHWLST